MAKLNLYTLFDIEAATITGPLLQATRHAAAVRSFQELINTADTLPHQYPEHFKLMWCGSMETETGEIMPVVPPVPVATGTQIAREIEERAKGSLELTKQ